jgi:AP-2 complex subunit alpha
MVFVIFSVCGVPVILCAIYLGFEFDFSSNQQRSQKIFKASQPMDLNAVRTKLLGFGMQLLDGIDPNPDNFVCAGIIHTRNQAVGCLLRLEPNKQAQVV